MPRATSRPQCFVALSPNACAVALGITPARVNDAVEIGVLPLYQIGAKRRILICDLQAWVRTWKRPAQRKIRKVPS